MQEPNRKNKMKHLLNKRWWGTFLLAIAVILAYRLIRDPAAILRTIGKAVSILSPFVGGFTLAYLLYRPCESLEQWLKKRKWPLFHRPARVWSILTVYLGLLGLIALAVGVVLPVVIQGVVGLVSSLPTYYETVVNFLNEHSQDGGLLSTLNVEELLAGVVTFLTDQLTVSNIMSYVSSIISVASSFVNVVITVIISVYMLASRERLLATVRRVLEAFLPERGVRLASHYSRKAGEIFLRYVYSMLIDALCVCLLLIPGMYISGIPYPLAFAVFVGVANLVPYFGAIISGCSCVLVLILSGQWGMALFLAVYIVVIQQVDSNLLQPRIYSQSVGIQPIYVLLAVTVGGGIAGFTGILLGVPVVAVLKILVSDYITHRNRLKRERAMSEGEAEDDNG